MELTLIFKPLTSLEKTLPTLISHSIGYPTYEKINRILASYQEDNRYLIGCFVDNNLIGVIGIEVLALEGRGIIKHISVSKDFRKHGIGKQLVLYAIKYFFLKNISAETDEEAVGFYRALGFDCKMFEGKYNRRYICKAIRRHAVVVVFLQITVK